MNPIIITDPKTINADLACKSIDQLRRYASDRALSCHLSRLRARIAYQVARMGRLTGPVLTRAD